MAQTRQTTVLSASVKMLGLLVLLCTICRPVVGKTKGVLQIDQQRAEYISLSNALWKYLEKGTNANAQLKKIYENHRTFVSDNLLKDFDEGKYFVLNQYYEWGVLEKDLSGINGLFGFFRTFLHQYRDGGYDERAALDLSETVLKDKMFSVEDVFKNIENVMVKQTLYYRAMMDAKDHLCATKQSPQQFLYSLYSDIALTELKGYTMMQFSWMMLRVYGKGNFTHEATLMREDFEKRSQRTQKLLREVMRRADRTVWRCDPTRFVKGQNYDEVTRLLQGYVENEVDMNPEGTCRENCNFYQVSKNHGCFKDLYCSRQPRCSGQLMNCRYYDSDMWICPSSMNSTRRYEYIEYENGRVLGRKKSCSRGTTKVDSWWRYLFWHCSYCFCLCDEQGIKSDRYFNLRETLANIDENMVVTGLRFVKSKRVFHLQIQEGKLLPRGNVNTSTIQWKPVEDYQIFDRDVRDGFDYHTLDANKRAVDLDDIAGDDPTHVVTGVRFRVVGAHLNLEARLSEYDFDTGELVSPRSNSFWKSNDNTDLSAERRIPIILNRPDIPLNVPTKSLPTSKHNQFIEFTHTDFDKDAAQTTVPFIDIQEVISNPPVPLAGIGIYHKGRDQSGGFLAPKIITYDFTPYIESPISLTANEN